MRFIRNTTATMSIVALLLSFAGGCAGPGSSGSSLVTPAAPVSLPAAASSEVASTAAIDLTPGTTTTQTWAQFGHDSGHSGYNALENTINSGNVSGLQVLWNDESIVQPGGIVVNDGVEYVDDMGQSNAGLYAIDAATGAQEWYNNVNLNGSWGSFTHAISAVAGATVVTPCSNGSSSTFLTGLCGVNAKTGKTRWIYYCQQYQGNPCGGLVNNGTSPALDNGAVYFQIQQGVNEQPDTVALNAQTGAVLWDAPGVYHCPDAGETSESPLPVLGGLVFAVIGCGASNGDTEICALSTTSGSAAWCNVSPTSYIEDSIGFGGKLYVTEPGNNIAVVAFDAETGAQSWSATLPGANGTSMAIANNRLYVNDGSAGVFALSAETGRSLWSYTGNANLTQGGVISVANGIVYTDGGGGNNGNVAIAAFNAVTGSLIWTSGSIANGGAPAAMAILNGTVYAGCYTLCAFTLPANTIRR
jgi:hypothetical protein